MGPEKTKTQMGFCVNRAWIAGLLTEGEAVLSLGDTTVRIALNDFLMMSAEDHKALEIGRAAMGKACQVLEFGDL